MKNHFLLLLTFFFLPSIQNKTLCQPSLKQNVIIGEIMVAGNNATKEQVVLRELLFESNDTILRKDIDELLKLSKESLLNTSLFNFVTINIIKQYENYINVFILVEERWYLWPYPIFEHADRNLSSFFKEQDWSRINYGMMLVKNNFRGRNETLQLKIRLGYKEQYQIMYSVPYLFHSKKHAFTTDFSYFRRKEIPYNTFHDKLLFYKDHNKYVKEFQSFYINYIYRHKHYTRHHFRSGYYHATVQDTIVALNEHYFDKNANQTQFIFLQYSFSLDKRDYQHYPLSGYNVHMNINQSGIGLLKNELNGISSLTFEAYHYQKYNIRWFSGYGTKGKMSSNRKQPYFIEQGLGFHDYLRAYEYYVIAGQHFISTRAFLKYAIIPKKVTHIQSWNWTKFNKIHYSIYANVFFETGYVHDIKKPEYNHLPNTLLMSSGIGIDITAYYDQIFRFEYSINKNGEHGVFVHVKKPF